MDIGTAPIIVHAKLDPTILFVGAVVSDLGNELRQERLHEFTQQKLSISPKA